MTEYRDVPCAWCGQPCSITPTWPYAWKDIDLTRVTHPDCFEPYVRAKVDRALAPKARV